MKTMRVYLGTIEGVKEFVNLTTKIDCDVDIVSGRYVIDAKSIMGIFSIDLSKPVELRVSADDERADEAITLLKKFEAK